MNNNRNKSCGRPAGKKKTAKIEISIEPNIKSEFMELLHNEGKTASVEIGNWIRMYIKSQKAQGENVNEHTITF